MTSSRSLKLLWFGVLLLVVAATLIIALLVLPNEWQGEKTNYALLAILLAEVVTFSWPILLSGVVYSNNSPMLPFKLGFSVAIIVYDLITILLVLVNLFLPVIVLKIGLVLNITFLSVTFLFFKIGSSSVRGSNEN